MGSSFTTTSDNRYFEDYIAGAVHEFGPIAVEEREVLDFGRRFVPLPYHVDREAAKKSVYGRLIASGWHTAALMMRLYSDNKPDRGIVQSFCEVLNQKREVVMSVKMVNFVRSRESRE